MELKDIRVGFVGFGNMAKAMARGMIRAGMPCKNITACARSWDKLVINSEEMGIIPCRDVYEASYYSDLVIVAVKPYQVETVLEEHKEVLNEKAVISVASGLGFEWYENFLEENTQHLTILPNTAVEIGKGVILRERTHSLQGEIAAKADILLNSLGYVEEVDDDLINVGSAITGCGINFAYMFVDSIADGAVKMGMPKPLAYRLAAEMIKGAGEMVLTSGRHIGQLRDEVCSPGGTTIKGVAALEEAGFRSAVIKAVEAAMTLSPQKD